MKATLNYAQPTPDYWSQELARIYVELFDVITSLDQGGDIGPTLERIQEEIDALRGLAKRHAQARLSGLCVSQTVVSRLAERWCVNETAVGP